MIVAAADSGSITVNNQDGLGADLPAQWRTILHQRSGVHA